MSVQLIHFSNCGPVRPVNQDAYCVRICSVGHRLCAMMAICDGMGGLNCGEIASADVITAFENWFDRTIMSSTDGRDITEERLFCDWNEIIQKEHSRLCEFAKKHSLRMGTTLSVILIYGEKACVLHVGDTRIYLENEAELKQLTKDQTLAMRELEAKRITAEEYRTDRRHNVLLQCIGDQSVTPSFYVYGVPACAGVLLCSDGFYHTVEETKLHHLLQNTQSKQDLQRELAALVRKARNLGETDNMTCIFLRWDTTELVLDSTRRMDAGIGDTEKKIVETLAKVSFVNAEPL